MKSVKELLNKKRAELKAAEAIQTSWDRLKDGNHNEVRQTPVTPEEITNFRKMLKQEDCDQKKYSDTEIAYMITIGTPLSVLREESYRESVLNERVELAEKRANRLPAIRGPQEIMMIGLDGNLALG